MGVRTAFETRKRDTQTIVRAHQLEPHQHDRRFQPLSRDPVSEAQPGQRMPGEMGSGHDFGSVPVHPAEGVARGDRDRQAGQGEGPALPHMAYMPSIDVRNFSFDPRTGLGSPEMFSPWVGGFDKSKRKSMGSQDQRASLSTFETTDSGVHMEVEARDLYSSEDYPDGFKWTQIIDTNEPLGGTNSPYVDPRPNDDSKPFYWTDAEQGTHPTTFIDYPSRPAPATGTTTWQATLALNGVNEGTKTVTMFDRLSYGFVRDSTGVITLRGPTSIGSNLDRTILGGEFTDWMFV